MMFKRRLVSLLLSLSVFAVASVNSSWYMASAYELDDYEIEHILGKAVTKDFSNDVATLKDIMQKVVDSYGARSIDSKIPSSTAKEIEDNIDVGFNIGKESGARIDKYYTILFGGDEFVTVFEVVTSGFGGERRFEISGTVRNGEAQLSTVAPMLRAIISSKYDSSGDDPEA